MKKTALAFALITGMTMGSAFAFQCPQMMAQIDEALPTAELSEADRERVMELRQQGEEQHAAGNHDESEASLGEAMEILGISS